MLATSEKHRYSDRHPVNVLWLFRPEGLKADELRPATIKGQTFYTSTFYTSTAGGGIVNFEFQHGAFTGQRLAT